MTELLPDRCLSLRLTAAILDVDIPITRYLIWRGLSCDTVIATLLERDFGAGPLGDVEKGMK